MLLPPLRQMVLCFQRVHGYSPGFGYPGQATAGLPISSHSPRLGGSASSFCLTGTLPLKSSEFTNYSFCIFYVISLSLLVLGELSHSQW